MVDKVEPAPTDDLYAKEHALIAFQQVVMADLGLGFNIIRVLRTVKAAEKGETRREPFGFVDGISQPEIDWDARREPGTSADLEYGNLIAAGEFLLGYQNGYGLYTQRPLLDPARDPDNILAPAADVPACATSGAMAPILCSGIWSRMFPAFGALFPKNRR
jgi:hypothetical protein